MAPGPRVAIVASGSELVRGDRHDTNGPFLAQALLALGFEPARITVVGDGPADLLAALEDGLRADLLVVSGGLGPTHDDRTVELLARACGVGLHVEPALEASIEARSRAVSERLGRPYTDFAAGVTKQATLPDGATWIDPVGTAPAVVLDTGRMVAVALPGPPRELQALWPGVLGTPPLRRLLARARVVERRVLRFYGVSESALARALADAGGDGDGVTVTICAHDFELAVDVFVEGGAGRRADELERALLEQTGRYLFAREELPTAALVLTELRARGLTLATAESCTGGLIATRLTDVPGSSDVFVGGVVAYSNRIKEAELAVRSETLATHGAVSAETAAEMAHGARRRLGADVAVSVTGIAGPDGGTSAKPVGLVYLCAAAPGGERALRLDLPGDRATIRARAAVAGLHLVRTLVTNS